LPDINGQPAPLVQQLPGRVLRAPIERESLNSASAPSRVDWADADSYGLNPDELIVAGDSFYFRGVSASGDELESESLLIDDFLLICHEYT
jgi:hypothetical protein